MPNGKEALLDHILPEDTPEEARRALLDALPEPPKEIVDALLPKAEPEWQWASEGVPVTPRTGVGETLGLTWREKVPFVGDLIERQRERQMSWAADYWKKMLKGEEPKIDERTWRSPMGLRFNLWTGASMPQKYKDIMQHGTPQLLAYNIMKDYNERAKKLNRPTTAAWYVDALLSMGKWMGEFALTGPIAKPVGALAKGLPKAVRGIAKVTARGLARLPFKGAAVEADTLRRMRPDIKYMPDGKIVVGKQGEGLVPALLRSLGTQAVELISEETGALIGPALAKIFPKKLRMLPVLRQVGKLLGHKHLERAGFHGILIELLEEDVADFGHALLGTADWKLTAPEKDWLGRVFDTAKGYTLKKKLEQVAVLGPPALLGIAGAALKPKPEAPLSVEEATAIMQDRDYLKFEAETNRQRIKAAERLVRAAELPEEVKRFAQAEMDAINKSVARTDAEFAVKELEKAAEPKYEVPPERAEEVRRIMPKKRGALEWLKQVCSTSQINHENTVRRIAPEGGVIDMILRAEPIQKENMGIGLLQNDFDNFKGELQKLGTSLAEVSKWSGDIVGKKAEIVRVNVPTAKDMKGNRKGQLKMTRAERLDIMLNTSDHRTLRRLYDPRQKGISWKADKDKSPTKLFVKDVEAIWKSAPKLDKKIIGLLMRHHNEGPINEMLDEVRRQSKDVNWKRRTDYYPREIHPEYIKRDPEVTMSDFVDFDLDDMGIFKPRVKVTAPIIMGDALTKYASSMNKKVAYVSKHIPAVRAVKLIENPEFRQAVRARYKRGDVILRNIKSAIVDYRGMQRKSDIGAIARFAQQALRKIHLGALGLKEWIVMYQKVSYAYTWNEGVPLEHALNPKNIAIAATGVGGKRIRAMLEKRPYLRARFEGRSHGLLTPSVETAATDLLFGPRGWLEKVMLGPIHWADTTTITGIGSAVHDWGVTQGLQGEALERFVGEKTEEIVRNTQPTWDTLTRSQLAREARKDPLSRLAIMFSSQRNKNLNILYRAGLKFQNSNKTAADYGELARSIALVTIVNALLVSAIYTGAKELYKILGRAMGLRDDDPEYNSKVANQFVLRSLQRVFGNWLVMGDALAFVSSFVGADGGTPSTYRKPRGNILGEMTEDTIMSIGELLNAVQLAASGAEYKDKRRRNESMALNALKRAGKHGMRGPAMFLGMPIEGLFRRYAWLCEQERKKKAKRRRGRRR